MATIERLEYGIVLKYNKITYNLPLNSLLVDADEKSKTINFRLKAYNKKNLVSIHCSEFSLAASTPRELVEIIEGIIYG